MDPANVALLRDILADTGWVDRTRAFAGALRRSTRTEDGLLLVGTPQSEPWHLTAHLDDEARLAGIPGLSPTLVRYAPPAGAPAHLSIGLDRLEQARRGETVFVVAPESPPQALLERVHDARRGGVTILAMDTGDDDLDDLAHESLIVPAEGITAPGSPSGLVIPGSIDVLGALDLSTPSVSFDVVEHLVSTAAGESDDVLAAAAGSSRRGFRDRLGRLLDTISGPSAPRDW